MPQYLAKLAYQPTFATRDVYSAITVQAANDEQARAAVAVALRSLEATGEGNWACRWVVEIDPNEVQLMYDARKKLQPEADRPGPESEDANEALRLTGYHAAKLLPGPGARAKTCPAEERHTTPPKD